MKRVTAIAAALFVAALMALTINVSAQDFNPLEKTYLTFSAPVELPGMTLPAGTYTFKLADTPSRNVVQVLSQDEKKIHGQFLFVQAQRRDASGDTVVTFRETAEGTTPAVQYWYYPGETIGKEFIYPKAQAEKIAARTGQQVRSEEGYVAANAPPVNSSADNVVQGPGLPAEADSTVKNAPAPAQPTASAGSLAGNRGITPEPSSQIAPEPSGQIARQDADRGIGTSGQANEHSVGTSGQLPKTGSDTPLVGLIGLLSLAGALGTRFVATRG